MRATTQSRGIPAVAAVVVVIVGRQMILISCKCSKCSTADKTKTKRV